MFFLKQKTRVFFFTLVFFEMCVSFKDAVFFFLTRVLFFFDKGVLFSTSFFSGCEVFLFFDDFFYEVFFFFV